MPSIQRAKIVALARVIDPDRATQVAAQVAAWRSVDAGALATLLGAAFPPFTAIAARDPVAFGMGKLGGRELNVGSDIDVLYVYDTDDGSAEGGATLHEWWARVARRMTATLDEQTEDGAAWRVDLRLRPEGSRGAIVNSASAALRYYEGWGRPWERAALLRAR